MLHHKPTLSNPHDSPHIWRDLAQLCETTLGQFTGKPGQIFDFYFRAPAAIAFQIGRLASSRQGGNRIFQYVYTQLRDEQAFDNIQGPCLRFLAAAKALKPTSKQQLEHSE